MLLKDKVSVIYGPEEGSAALSPVPSRPRGHDDE